MADSTKKYVSENTLLYFWQKLKLLLANKVDTENGKGLSSNDFTSELKTKLENMTQGLTQAEVEALIADVVDSAPAALDTLKELADALGDDANFASTMTTALASKLNTADLVEVTNVEVDAIMADTVISA